MIYDEHGEPIDWGAAQLAPTLSKATGNITAYAALPICLIPIGIVVPAIGIFQPIMACTVIALLHYHLLHKRQLTARDCLKRSMLWLIGHRRRLVRSRLSAQCRSGFRSHSS